MTCGRHIVLAFVVLAAGHAGRTAAQSGWQPSPGHTQIRIWPAGAMPDARPGIGAEVARVVLDSVGRPRLVGARPWIYVDSVTQPTMTVYSPSGRNTGAAVVVFPGGGYNILAIDLEGTEACDWLTSRGITCVLLKYRVPCATTGPHRDCRTALEDAQRTVGLLRFHAARWHLNPHKIGVLGFSAGGHMVAAIRTHFVRRIYRPVDAADTVSCRPDFAIALYPGHLAGAGRHAVLNPDIRVTRLTPPTLLVQARNDPVDRVANSIVYHAALARAGVPVEMHLYPTGGHAFGLRRTRAPITAWPEVAERWLGRIGVIPNERSSGAAPRICLLPRVLVPRSTAFWPTRDGKDAGECASHVASDLRSSTARLFPPIEAFHRRVRHGDADHRRWQFSVEGRLCGMMTVDIRASRAHERDFATDSKLLEHDGGSLIQLRDKTTNALLGTIDDDDLKFLVDELEEESPTDQDYYFDSATIEMLEDDGAPATLVALLRQVLGSQDGMEMRWERH
ncbi:MAG TPA: alpha/beta hydrolase [Gemmatimonadaceae bacterium]|nr:alpha/beta hydrolase [Gemmatimonadaceae bacterium]